jgi:hypothetical protein
MANSNPEPGNVKFRGSENDGLDRVLDTALAKYTAVEPRAGLDERVLAGLCARQAEAPQRTWWRWGLAGALAAIFIAALLMGVKSNKPSPQQTATHPPIHEPSPNARQAPVMAENRPQTARPTVVPTRSAHPRPTAVHSTAAAKANPKLDIFPSPRPLSKEELALARYVRDFPEEAIIVARAQAELDAEVEKEMQAGASDSEQQER